MVYVFIKSCIYSYGVILFILGAIVLELCGYERFLNCVMDVREFLLIYMKALVKTEELKLCGHFFVLV